MFFLLDKLETEHKLTLDEYKYIIENHTEESDEYLFTKARRVRERYYGKDVYIRGLIEFTNYCKNDCLYCGIRRSNKNCSRYRLTEDEIYSCCEEGYKLGFRTFVLQGGEDNFYTDDKLCNIISDVKKNFPDCAVTLSIGEKTYEQYKAYFDAGADRYLLRHETADNEHYKRLHPIELSLDNRKQCLYNLKKIGYQVGTGFMVGSPYQTAENLAEDMLFIK
ncbi:MAG: [FeFe] hydrogenase H-cluster radical SAM maturase HydE, partial [Oscillospiraceae bacterium]